MRERLEDVCEKIIAKGFPCELGLACFLTPLQWSIHSIQAKPVGQRRGFEGETSASPDPLRSLKSSSSSLAQETEGRQNRIGTLKEEPSWG